MVFDVHSTCRTRSENTYEGLRQSAYGRAGLHGATGVWRRVV